LVLVFLDGLIDAYRLSINPSLEEALFQGTYYGRMAMKGSLF
jgi:hypothetical protein